MRAGEPRPETEPSFVLPDMAPMVGIVGALLLVLTIQSRGQLDDHHLATGPESGFLRASRKKAAPKPPEPRPQPRPRPVESSVPTVPTIVLRLQARHDGLAGRTQVSFRTGGDAVVATDGVAVLEAATHGENLSPTYQRVRGGGRVATFLPGGERALFGGEGSWEVRDLTRGSVLTRLQVPASWDLEAVSPRGNFALFGNRSANRSPDEVGLGLYDLRSGRQVGRLPAHDCGMPCAVENGGQVVAAVRDPRRTPGGLRLARIGYEIADREGRQVKNLGGYFRVWGGVFHGGHLGVDAMYRLDRWPSDGGGQAPGADFTRSSSKREVLAQDSSGRYGFAVDTDGHAYLLDVAAPRVQGPFVLEGGAEVHDVALALQDTTLWVAVGTRHGEVLMYRGDPAVEAGH